MRSSFCPADIVFEFDQHDLKIWSTNGVFSQYFLHVGKAGIGYKGGGNGETCAPGTADWNDWEELVYLPFSHLTITMTDRKERLAVRWPLFG